MKKILEKLFEHKKLSKTEAREILTNISTGRYNESQIAAFITVYLMRPIAVEELQGFREALLELCVSVDLEGVEAIDVCGTGGDGKNTFNISTLSAFVVAGAGYKVAKHGNYGVSSACGSSDVLNFLGYEFTANTDRLKTQLDKVGITFFHAPLFHPALKTVGPIRKQLGVKTFFNMLGPLVNPAQPSHQVTGVFSLELARLYQYIFQQIPNKKFAIVHALDGYDEVSLTGDFQLKMNQLEATFSPHHVGKTQLSPESLFGGDTVAEAGKIFLDILGGGGTAAQNDAVAVNAGIAIHTFKPQVALVDCIVEAEISLQSGAAMKKLKALVKN